MIDGITYVPLSDIGMEREENQDYQGHDVTPHGLVFIVADGMGGHAGGATASQMTVNFMKRALRDTDIADPAEALDYSVRAANRAIFDVAQRRPDLRGMGSTVVSVLMSGNVAWFAHVGDSRIYMLRDKQLMCLTKDHTMVQRMVDDGFLTEADAENHPSSHVLSRSLGGRDMVEVEMCGAPLELQVGDTFLLCSDGLTGLVRDGEIARTLLQYELHTAARLLVDEANSRGGYDNSTIALVRVDKLPMFSNSAYDPPPARAVVPPPAPSANSFQVMRVPDISIEDEFVDIDSGDSGTDDPDETLHGTQDAEEETQAGADGGGQEDDSADGTSEDAADAEEAGDDAEEASAADEAGVEEAGEAEEASDTAEEASDAAEEARDDDAAEDAASEVSEDAAVADPEESLDDALPPSSDNAPTQEWSTVPKMVADAGLHGLEDSLSTSMEIEPAAEPEPVVMAASEAPSADILPPAEADAWALPEDFSSLDEAAPSGDDAAEGEPDESGTAEASADVAADGDEAGSQDAAAAEAEAVEDDAVDAATDDAEDAADDEEDAADTIAGLADPDVTADILVDEDDPDSSADSTAELPPAPRLTRPPANPLELAHKVIEVAEDGPRLVPHTRRLPPQILTPIEAPQEAPNGVAHTTLLIVGVVAVTIGLLVGVFVGRAPLSNYENLIKASKLNEKNLADQVEKLRVVQLPDMMAERDKERAQVKSLQKDLELTNTALESKEAENTKLLEKITTLEAKVKALEPPPEDPPAP